MFKIYNLHYTYITIPIAFLFCIFTQVDVSTALPQGNEYNSTRDRVTDSSRTAETDSLQYPYLFSVGTSFDLVEDVIADVYFDSNIFVPYLFGDESIPKYLPIPNGIKLRISKANNPSRIDTTVFEYTTSYRKPDSSRLISTQERNVIRKRFLIFSSELTKNLTNNFHLATGFEYRQISEKVTSELLNTVSSDTSIISDSRGIINARNPSNKRVTYKNRYSTISLYLGGSLDIATKK